MRRVDCIVVGAGIAGASAAYELSSSLSVLLLEREEHPGYHATGRSAALLAETYGSPVVRALTAASKTFLSAPPAGFCATPLMTPRPILLIGRDDQQKQLDLAYDENASFGIVRRVSGEEACTLVPVLRPDVIKGGVLEQGAQDIDVDALHRGYLRAFAGRGGTLALNADVKFVCFEAGTWRISTPAGSYEAPVLVNAAGAWADVLAHLAGVAPVGLMPKRRSAFTFPAPASCDIGKWPAAIDIDETFYFKPEAGVLLGSPANEDPVTPQDVQPEELDIAYGVDRIENATTLQITRIGRRWAGLRSFVADRTPVNGFDSTAPGFYWLAGQGGYGIQTAPAMAALCAASILGNPLSDELQQLGIEQRSLSPTRLQRRSAA